MADQKEESSSSSSSSTHPHEALFFVLPYLPLFELLVITQVCKSIRDAVSNDILPWLKIIAHGPLSLRLTDEILIKLAFKAKGRLQFLALFNCVQITDDGLFNVVAQNAQIIKLHVPGCTKLTAAGVIRAVAMLTKNKHRLKSLGINGISHIEKEDLKTLSDLLNTHKKQSKILYHQHNNLSTLNNNDPIDVDICPKCDKVRTVFDCPQLLCTKKSVRDCRGCCFCILRCVECGVCIDATEEIEEASCADTLCLECWIFLPKCSFCNKPYCKRHANQWHEHPSSGVVCANCCSKFMSDDKY